MNLFSIENNIVVFSPQALLIKPFKDIWDSDKSDDKSKAAKYLGFIYYMADQRSDFLHILDEQERIDEIKKYMDLPPAFKGTGKTYVRAIHFYKQISETTSTRLLTSTRLVIKKISQFLDTINMNERDPRSNKLVHDIGKITSSVEKIPKLIKALNEVEKEVIKEKEMKASSGNKTSAMFEDTGM
jgi:hypothetical protein|tara:strand:- start:1244 stop:1798 length:555 start_codon:yes stop_codon:yes gene_type:complete